MSTLLARYDEWEQGRSELSEMEGEGNFPSPDAWQASDDDGCSLAGELAEALRRAKPLIDAAEDLASMLASNSDLFGTTMQSLSCYEADALTELVRLAGYPQSADELLASHAETDEEGDEHYSA